MLSPMRWLLSIVAAAGLASAAPAQTPAAQVPLWNPAGFYVTAGQDEPGYRVWYAGAPHRGVQVKAFHDYLGTYGVAGIVPTWQLLRTASSWRRCGAQPFEVPPTTDWPHIVQTLRYLRDFVVPTVGPVEPVSAYRNPLLNTCAGGAVDSAHRHFLAVDLVPLRPLQRDAMMADLCAVHARQGNAYQVGLGFYAYMRFHIDSMKYRRWGGDGTPEASPCAAPLPTAPAAALTSAGDISAKGAPRAGH
jgi:hypothetical protein